MSEQFRFFRLFRLFRLFHLWPTSNLCLNSFAYFAFCAYFANRRLNPTLACLNSNPRRILTRPGPLTHGRPLTHV